MDEAALGWIGEEKPETAVECCLGLCLGEPREDRGEAGRRGKRSPACGIEFEFASGREEESRAEEEETVVLVLVLGILVS